MFKKNGMQRGRNKRGEEAYVVSYVKPLSAVSTKLTDFFILLSARSDRPAC